VIIWKKIENWHISSSFNWQNGFGRHFENRLGDYRVIITSTATNQRGEFSIITHVIMLIYNIQSFPRCDAWVFSFQWRCKKSHQGRCKAISVEVPTAVYFLCNRYCHSKFCSSCWLLITAALSQQLSLYDVGLCNIRVEFIRNDVIACEFQVRVFFYCQTVG
jgi:hypothetical protein